jgi:NADPH:quinone reductase-like Zn-dependent oxidoreductase
LHVTCAGVTAFNGLYTRGHLRPGEWVLIEGTGGVSVLGLQLAVAGKAWPLVISSSDLKLERAKELGAVGSINYREFPKWEEEIRKLTEGRGVAHVLEVGGESTRPHALAALAFGGHVALIGGLGGFGGSLSVEELGALNATASGIYVGSRGDLESLLRFVAEHHVKPVVDRIFPYSEAPGAFGLLESGNLFGKIVIRVQ